MKSSKMKVDKVAKAAERWQRCRQEDLPRAFYAYDKKTARSERVVSYYLEKNELEDLLKGVDVESDNRLIVHLGLHETNLQEPVPNSPAFVLYLQLATINKGDQPYRCQPLKWAKNTRFTKRKEGSTGSKRNAIPAASAYLFVESWQQLAEIALALPFTSAYRQLGRRVKSYTFTQEESRSILRDLKFSGQNALEIHLGSGLAVNDHPYSFRPVIEVKGGATKKSNQATHPGINRVTNGEGDSFFDFGDPDKPDPPKEGEG